LNVFAAFIHGCTLAKCAMKTWLEINLRRQKRLANVKVSIHFFTLSSGAKDVVQHRQGSVAERATERCDLVRPESSASTWRAAKALGGGCSL
jgi:hypothetical protein